MQRFFVNFLSKKRKQKHCKWREVRSRSKVRNKREGEEECGECTENSIPLERGEGFLERMKKVGLSIRYLSPQ